MKVLVVDDSFVFRKTISLALQEVPGVEVLDSVGNGESALRILERDPSVDLVTLDMQMPIMDGLTCIKEIRKINKSVVIIVFSSLTEAGATLTIEALSSGANDFVLKPKAEGAHSLDSALKVIKDLLVPRIQAFENFRGKAIQPSATKTSLPLPYLKRPELVVFASSTGGPDALIKIFKNIKHPLELPVLLVQHMPPLFTEKLANMLDSLCPHLNIVEAKDGNELKPNTCYIAPGDFHMIIDSKKIIRTIKSEKVSFVRPSATVLFESLALHFPGHILGFVLTGMGDDGALGAKKLVDKKAQFFIQDEASSTVWGMPSALKKLVPQIPELDLNDISTFLNKLVE